MSQGGSNPKPAFTTPAITLAATAAAGLLPHTVRADSTIAAFDATNPTTQAFGDSAAVGSAAFAARRDHRHGVPVAAHYNAITNPACNSFQRGNSGAAAGDATTWCDSWTWFQSGGGAVQHAAFPQNNLLSGASGPISINWASDVLQLLTTTADTSIGASEYYMLRQSIEGYNAQALASGMSLSFYMYAIKAGIYSVSLGTRSGARIYVMEANIPASTWTYCAFPNISAPPVWEGDMRTQTGLVLRLILAGGSGFQTSLINQWNTGSFFISTNQVNGVDTVNNAVYLYGVNLVPGPIAIPYRPQDYGAELTRVQRYRQKISVGGFGRYGACFSDGSTIGYAFIPLPTPMLSAPSAIFTAANTFGYYQLAAIYTPTGLALSVPRPEMVTIQATGMAGLTSGAAGFFMDAGSNTSSILLDANPA